MAVKLSDNPVWNADIQPVLDAYRALVERHKDSMPEEEIWARSERLWNQLDDVLRDMGLEPLIYVDMAV